MRDYSLGFRMVGFYARPQLTHPILKRIATRAAKSEAVKLARERKAIVDGRIKTLVIDGVVRVMCKRDRVGKYFSANGGKIEPSSVTLIRNSRSKPIEAMKVEQPAILSASVKDAPKRTKVQRQIGYVMRVDGIAHPISVKQLPAFAH